MDQLFQIILLIGTIIFSGYIFYRVKRKKLELKYSLLWIFACFSFMVMAAFPSLIDSLSSFLRVKDPVNMLFFIVLFFLITIIFTLTTVLSEKSRSISTLAQEIGIMKLHIYRLEREQSLQDRQKKCG